MRKHKKLWIGLGLGIALTGFAVWYSYPFICFLNMGQVRRGVASVIPDRMAKLPLPPEDWQRVHLGNIDIRLPLQTITSIQTSADASISILASPEFTMTLTDMVESDVFKQSSEDIRIQYSQLRSNFQRRVSIVSAHPRQISFFRRSASVEVICNLIIKSIPEDASGFTIVEAGNKAIITSFQSKKMVACEVFFPSQKICFNLYVVFKEFFDYDFVLKILGSIEVVEDRLDEDKYKEDVKRISTRILPPPPEVPR